MKIARKNKRINRNAIAKGGKDLVLLQKKAGLLALRDWEGIYLLEEDKIYVKTTVVCSYILLLLDAAIFHKCFKARNN